MSTHHLLAELAAGRRPPDAIPASQWEAIAERALAHQLGPLLLHRLNQASVEPPPAPIWERVRHRARISALAYPLLSGAQTEIGSALQGHAIAPIWLKGIVLAPSVYPAPATRPMNDIDLLVAPDDFSAAREIVLALGYQPHHPDTALFSPEQGLLEGPKHHEAFAGGPAEAVRLELHRYLVSTEEKILPDTRQGWFLSQRQPIDGGFALAPAAHLLYLCAHARLQHHDDLLLRYLDIHLLIEHEALDWEFVVRQAAALRWTSVVGKTLRRCEAWFATPLPPDLHRRLDAARPVNENQRLLAARHGAGARWRRFWPQLRERGLADSIRVIGRVLFPPPAYMRTRYHIPAGQALWPAYLRRWRSQMADVLAAVLRRERD